MATISVIVPIYNVKDYLDRCVESIVNQTYRDLEIILVDDGSTDGSALLCDDWENKDNRIRVVHQKNKGLSGARNAGLEIASGEYLSFIDGDDWIDKEFYTYLKQLIDSNNCSMASCAYFKTHGKGQEQRRKRICIRKMNKEESLIWFLKGAIKGGVSDVSCCTKLYKREVFDDILFPENVIFEDVITNWKIVNKLNGYIYSDCVKYYYYMRDDSITRKNFKMNVFDLEIGANIIMDDVRNMSTKVQKLATQYKCRVYFSILVKMLKSKNVDLCLIKETVKKVKRSYKHLIFSCLSIKRKIALTMFVILPEKLFCLYMR